MQAEMLLRLVMKRSSEDSETAAFRLFMGFYENRPSDDAGYMTDIRSVCAFLLTMARIMPSLPCDDETRSILQELLYTRNTGDFNLRFGNWCAGNDDDRDKIIGLLRFCRDVDYNWGLIYILVENSVWGKKARFRRHHVIDCMSRLGNIGNEVLIKRLIALTRCIDDALRSPLTDKMFDFICDDSIHLPTNVFWEDFISGDL